MGNALAPFSDDEPAALQQLQASYEVVGDTLSSDELARLRFVRWLYTTAAWSRNPAKIASQPSFAQTGASARVYLFLLLVASRRPSRTIGRLQCQTENPLPSRRRATALPGLDPMLERTLVAAGWRPEDLRSPVRSPLADLRVTDLSASLVTPAPGGGWQTLATADDPADPNDTRLATDWSWLDALAAMSGSDPEKRLVTPGRLPKSSAANLERTRIAPWRASDLLPPAIATDAAQPEAPAPMAPELPEARRFPRARRSYTACNCSASCATRGSPSSNGWRSAAPTSSSSLSCSTACWSRWTAPAPWRRSPRAPARRRAGRSARTTCASSSRRACCPLA